MSGSLWAILTALHAGAGLTAAPTVDPFKPLPEASEVGAIDKPVLNMVISLENQKVAVINGKQYRIGDAFSGGKIRAINSQTVTVYFDGMERLYIEMFPKNNAIKDN